MLKGWSHSKSSSTLLYKISFFFQCAACLTVCVRVHVLCSRYLRVGEACLQLQRVRVVLVRARAQRGALLLQLAHAPRRARQRRRALRERALQRRHVRLQLGHAALADF